MSKIKQIILAATKLKNTLLNNSPKNHSIDLEKARQGLCKAIVRREKFDQYCTIKYAVLSHRLYTNPITNKTIARYVWDLHEMNYN